MDTEAIPRDPVPCGVQIVLVDRPEMRDDAVGVAVPVSAIISALDLDHVERAGAVHWPALEVASCVPPRLIVECREAGGQVVEGLSQVSARANGESDERALNGRVVRQELTESLHTLGTLARIEARGACGAEQGALAELHFLGALLTGALVRLDLEVCAAVIDALREIVMACLIQCADDLALQWVLCIQLVAQLLKGAGEGGVHAVAHGAAEGGLQQVMSQCIEFCADRCAIDTAARGCA